MTALERAREEKIIARIFFQKIRRYKVGKGEGGELKFTDIPRLGEDWKKMYDWLILLMIYIDEMVSWDWDLKEIRTDRMKIVIQEAAVLAERKGTEQLTVPD